METNLFSIFDPATFFKFPLNWLMLTTPALFSHMQSLYWPGFSYYNMVIQQLLLNIYKEFISLTKSKFINNIFLFTMLMFFIMLLNLISLLPYVFTSFSQIVISLSFSLSLWFSFMFYGWLINTNHMFTHMLPMNTPYPLMTLMILIESISNFIRPWTLAIRLSANMVAGHLLLNLLGSTFIGKTIYIMLLLFIVQNMLMFLEMCVSVIQSYVFSMLSSMYFNESNK